jgi:uncharacterized protein
MNDPTPVPALLPPPGPLWHPLARAALYLAGYVLVQAIVAAVVGVLLAFTLGDGLFSVEDFASPPEIFLLVIVLSAPPTVAMTWLFVRFLDRRTLASLGARWPRGRRRAALRQLVAAPLGTLALLGSWLAVILALPSSLADVRWQGMDPQFTAGAAWWPLPSWLLLALLLLGFLLQGGLEEWIMRGYVYRALKDRWRPWTAALASSVLFALVHAANPGVSGIALLNIALAGLVLAALVERTGSLWSASLAHGIWNFTVACLLSLPVSGVRMFDLLEVSIRGDAWLTGGDFGPEGSLVLTLLGLPLSAALWWPLRRRRPPEEIAPSAPEDAASQASSEETMV